MRDLKVFDVICRVVVVTAAMFPLSRPSYGQAPVANTKTQPETDKEGTARSTASPDEQPDALLEQAKSLLDKGSLDRAEHAVRQYLDKHPVSADGHFLLGYVLFKEAKAEASLAEYTEGARYHDPSAFDLKVVALNYVLLGSYTDADHWLTRSLEWNPKDSEGWYYLGLSYEGLGRTEEAVAAYRKAIAWQGQVLNKKPGPFINLGSLLLEHNQIEDAIAYLSQAAQINPQDSRAHEQLGKAYSRLDELQKAQDELEKAIALAPDSASLHFMLGQVYRKRGMTEKAKLELARGAALNATRSQAHPPHPLD